MKILIPLIRKVVPNLVVESFGSVRDPLLDEATNALRNMFNPKATAASVNYIDETWMLMNGYIKKTEKTGCTGLLYREWWEKS